MANILEKRLKAMMLKPSITSIRIPPFMACGACGIPRYISGFFAWLGFQEDVYFGE